MPTDTMEREDYTLTREEYESLCDSFYSMKSLLKTLQAAVLTAINEDEDAITMLDVQESLAVIHEKAEEIEPHLGK